MIRLVLLGFWLGMASMPAWGNEKRLAVLELQGELSSAVLLLISDEVRAGALQALKDQDGYSVMTRENTMALITDMGLDPEECTAEANCEVDAGRMIGADYIVSGFLVRVEDSWMLTLKLFETHSGKLLSSKRVSAASQTALIDEVLPGGAALVVDGMPDLPTEPPPAEVSETTVEPDAVPETITPPATPDVVEATGFTNVRIKATFKAQLAADSFLMGGGMDVLTLSDGSRHMVVVASIVNKAHASTNPQAHIDNRIVGDSEARRLFLQRCESVFQSTTQVSRSSSEQEMRVNDEVRTWTRDESRGIIQGAMPVGDWTSLDGQLYYFALAVPL